MKIFPRLLASALIALQPMAAFAATTHYIITIPEMHCESCTSAVIGTLSKRPEVAKATADLTTHQVDVALKPKATISEEKLRELVEASGFTPTTITEKH